MASNREERLQMRQRGAASRKTKAIDFGFSFGLPTASDEPSQSTSRPDNVGISLFPPVPPPASTTDTAVNTTTPVAATEPEITQPSIISPVRKLSAQEGPIRRTPGSARNKLPPRPSPYDLPTEDPPEVGPSRKIRKLDHSRRTSTISFSARDEESSQPLNNGVASIAAPQWPPKPTSPPALNGTQHSQEVLSTTHVVQEDPAPLQPPQLAEPVAPDHATEPPLEPQQEPQAKSTPSPPGEETRGKRKRRTSRDSDVSSRRSPRRSPRGSPQNAVSPKAADVEGSQVSAAMDTSPDGKSPVTASPKIAAPDTTGSQDDTTQDVTEPQATSEPQIPAAQISSEEETTAAGKITQPRIVSEAEATGSLIASEPQEAAEPQDAVEPEETNGIGKAAEPHSTTTQTKSPTPPRTKRTREQRAASVQPHSTTARQSRVVRAGSAESAPVQGMERKRLRGRIGKNQEPMPSIPTLEEEPADDTGATVSSQPKDGTVIKGSRQSRLPRPTTVADKKSTRAGRPGRKPARSQDIQEEVPMREEEAQQPEEQQHEPEPESKAVTEPEAYLQPEARTEPKPSRPVRRGRGRKPLPENTDDAQASNEEIPAQAEQAEPETEVQLAQQTEPPQPAKRGRGRPLSRKENDVTQAPNEEPTAQAEAVEPEPVPEPEEEPQPEPPAEPEPARPAKRARGRKPASKEKDDTIQAADEEATAQDEPAEPTEEAPPPKKRKPRQPRGETVPVTVHRFVNATALGEGPEPEESSDEEEESAEGLTAKQKTKLVSRGGVNAADVLSQICRETLEKTLATLKNGIANEGNAARRAEWTRKKKAVEAYGTELEGRLFELSEMLDSNFVLGRQIKKSKREMMDLRSRLYRVRKEREDVALQMDAVRRKHSEEENAKMARSTINNSLHSLDLALERSRNRPVDESTSQNPEPSSTAGLEFLVRNVAENVSSIAPGAQGGLLHQIKSFNAQLEATARRLES